MVRGVMTLGEKVVRMTDPTPRLRSCLDSHPSRLAQVRSYPPFTPSPLRWSTLILINPLRKDVGSVVLQYCQSLLMSQVPGLRRGSSTPVKVAPACPRLDLIVAYMCSLGQWDQETVTKLTSCGRGGRGLRHCRQVDKGEHKGKKAATCEECSSSCHPPT